MNLQSMSWKEYLKRDIYFVLFFCPLFLLAGYLIGGEGESGYYRPNWTLYLFPLVTASVLTYWVLMPLSYQRVSGWTFLHYISFLVSFYIGYGIDAYPKGMAGIGMYFVPVVFVLVVLVAVLFLYLFRKFRKIESHKTIFLNSGKKWCFAFFLVLLFMYGCCFLYFWSNELYAKPESSVIRDTDSIVLTIVSRLGNYYWDKQNPDYSKWCDNILPLMRQSQYTPYETLKSPLDDIGPCSYAFNKYLINCDWQNIPEDVIILYDAKPGWNQIGGEELIQTRLYDNQEGIYVGYRKKQQFILKKDIPKIKWTID